MEIIMENYWSQTMQDGFMLNPHCGRIGLCCSPFALHLFNPFTVKYFFQMFRTLWNIFLRYTMFICICVYVLCMFVCTCRSVCMCVYACVCLCMYVRMYVCLCTCMYVCVYMRVYVCV